MAHSNVTLLFCISKLWLIDGSAVTEGDPEKVTSQDDSLSMVFGSLSYLQG